MNENTDWLKKQILRRYIDGFSQEQIAIEFDISEGAVSEYLQESRHQDDTLIFQHEIAVNCMKTNTPIRQLASSLAFSNAVRRLAFDQNKINLVLNALNKIAVEDGSFRPEKFGKLILQICNFIEANGTSLEETHTLIQEKTQELSELKKKIVESKKTLARIERDRIEALSKRRIKLAELRTFRICKRAFHNAGVDFINLKPIINVISVIMKLDCNPDLIVNEMRKTSVLESRKESLEKECDERLKNLQIYEDQELARAKYHNTRIIAVELVNKTLMRGVHDDEIISLFDAILDHKFYLSIPDLIKDINTYGGIKPAIFKLKREIENLKSEKNGLSSEGPSNLL